MKVLLVDDHMLFRSGIKHLLAGLGRELSFIEAGNCTDAVAFAADPPDLILLDLSMPGASGTIALETLRAAFDAVPIVVLSSEEHPPLIRRAIDLGASGFVPKTSSPQVLVGALQLILAGGVYLPPHVLRDTAPRAPSVATAPTIAAGPGEPTAGGSRPHGVASPASGQQNPAEVDGLSDRQRDVLVRAILGRANKVIARELGISEGTVKSHLSSAFRVLGVSNRTEAVFAAAKLGLVTHLRPTQPDPDAH